MPNLFKVFISSTWQDLQPERQAVESAILRMRDTDFAGMEYFGSRTETPRDVSLAEVDTCNLYIGIFARRYGSGITEDEYRRAVARNVPVLVYIKDKNASVPPEFVESDPVKAGKLDALIRELMSKHVISFFKNPDQLATQIVADLHSQMGRMMTMDVSELAKQLAPILIQFLPYLVKAGGTVAEEAGKKLGGESWDKVKSLWGKLQPKVETKPAAQEAVQDVAQNPKDEDAQAALRQQIKKILGEDEALAREIEPMVKSLQQANVTVVASGDRSVAVGGNVTGGTIITGDANSVRSSDK
jgi:hypothetical protein